MAFHMTAAAAREILAAAERSGAAGMALRVAARPAADGSMTWGMGFDEPAADDEVTIVEGLMVLVGASSSTLLADAALDYVQLDSGERDFVFLQPAASGCATNAGGCGSGRCGSCGASDREGA